MSVIDQPSFQPESDDRDDRFVSFIDLTREWADPRIGTFGDLAATSADADGHRVDDLRAEDASDATDGGNDAIVLRFPMPIAFAPTADAPAPLPEPLSTPVAVPLVEAAPEIAPEDTVIDLTDDVIDLTDDVERTDDLDSVETAGTVAPTIRERITGMRVNRLRLGSVARIGSFFFAFAYTALLGTSVVLWNVAGGLGLIGQLETTVGSALGLETFEISGQALFRVVFVLGGLGAGLGLALLVLSAAVYNAACRVTGGLAVETGPLSARSRPVRAHA